MQKLRYAWVLVVLVRGIPHACAEPVDFNSHIRPILSDNCFFCHGPDAETREADLRLDVEDDAKADRGGYHAVLAGDPAASELVRRILSDDSAERMPPVESGKQLTSEQIELLERWVSEGASWPAAWSYVAPKSSQPPEVADESWCRNWIDDFILARLTEAGRAPSAAADPVTLVRRLSFDLTGLPPDPDLVERFASDPSDENYAAIVDELLASPHFGERLTMYWLDLVRFADTVGYHGDQTHNIWPYRDYVIHAFNTNMPFDRFTREQLAGDLLEDASLDQQIATGYNRLLQTSHEGGIQLKEYRAIYLADRVRNVSQVWMGATVGCAQCHDHKYDPYTSRDFYALGAFFADVDEETHVLNQYDNLNTLPTARVPEVEVLSVYQRDRLGKLETELAAAERAQDASAMKQLRKLRDELAANKSSTMVTRSIEPREVRVLPRGDWLDESGEVVLPAVPEFLGDVGTAESRATRLDLANWLTDPQDGAGGLTARVMANRLWYLLFGEGLARVLDDFGGQGEAPTHPQLLDNLAMEFVESGWDIKHVLKLIATSSTYRQTSQSSLADRQADPLNRLVGRQARFRLPAEAVRDTALSVSGLLDESVGGRSVRPYQPPGYFRHLNFPKRRYRADREPNQWRRSVYMHWQRQFLHPMLKALDAPSREECTAKRQRSNTSLAALTLLNDPIFVEAARSLAERVLRQDLADDSARLEYAFRQAVSRSIVEEELQLFSDLLVVSRNYYAQSPDEAEELLNVGRAQRATQFPAPELAAWTTLTRVILNLAETTSRN